MVHAGRTPDMHANIRVTAAASAAVSLLGATLAVSPAVAASVQPAARLPVNWDFATGWLAGVNTPDTAPPGADTACQPSAPHPYPVILVNGTYANQDDNWQAAAPLLADHGYCVYTFNYGGAGDFTATGDIAVSAAQLATFVSQVLAATGAAQVDLVGHSQGGMMPRYYLKFLGGAPYVHTLVGLAPSNHGTTLDGTETLVQILGQLTATGGAVTPDCVACTEQDAGSAFLASLNAGGDTVPGPSYTVIETRDDEVITPYTSAFLSGPDVTNITVQNQCPLDKSDHLELAYDPVALADVLNALDPANPVPVPCLPVLPLTGPALPVPPF
jgi:triacylglycerol esterase/lipase EstA (alpha/beta hydrolase family)